MMTQVIGRSGRGDFEGKAYIQTTLPDNDIIELSAQQDYESFFEMESVIRKSMVYPPYCDICSVTFTSELFNNSFKSAKIFSDMVIKAVSEEFTDVKINLLGPIQPRVSKISNKYRNVLTIKCKNNKRFRSMMSQLLKAYLKDTKNCTASVTVDINPLS